MRNMVGILLLYSYYILGVPCLRFLLTSVYHLLLGKARFMFPVQAF